MSSEENFVTTMFISDLDAKDITAPLWFYAAALFHLCIVYGCFITVKVLAELISCIKEHV